MHTQSIKHNSHTIFWILNQTQQQDSELRDNIAEPNTLAKLQAGFQGNLGQVIDLFI